MKTYSESIGSDLKMPKAENREHFIETWMEHIAHMKYLSHSLPSKRALELLQLTKQLEKFVQEAATHVYGEQKLPSIV